ncbi:aspartyl-phosphate phosphatase Spo0E family protein [Bacillus sp. CLL-7-23]|uniref:Aspartyl-phosphate phosphatase Spo0E family protein n=1 Tax=Bacillus changyiensis TaxID=3004103 RepID=A0ABT4X285_9BACI|nr:aspartyl-phosphate phosphatase Spo0E family protein [Bacillus changyiensis]MDA7026217.1 aspartyl-phosphate phosphatase Spo0E family protein [Bacillus changyiensis]
MHIDREALLVSINEKRQKMVEAAEIHGYTGHETIKQSQELDQLIYQYQKMSVIDNDSSEQPLHHYVDRNDCLIVEKFTA